MLIEVKAKVSRVLGDTNRKTVETFLLEGEFFSEAEYAVTALLTEEQNSGLVTSSEIISLKQSPIKEIDEHTFDSALPSFMLSLRDIFYDDNGNEKLLRYKVILWAKDLSEAHKRAIELSRQGYDMLIEGIKQIDYIYIKK